MLDLRRRWQRVMQADLSREIEELTGRKVIGFMSDNHIDPDLAVEVFVLEPLPPPRKRSAIAGRPASRSPVLCLSVCGRGRVGEPFADERELTYAGALLARRDPRRRWRGVVRAVVAVVDHDAVCVAVLGVRPRGELGLGGVGVL